MGWSLCSVVSVLLHQIIWFSFVWMEFSSQMLGLFRDGKQSTMRRGGQEERFKSAFLIQAEMLMWMYYINLM